ncbi:hypothetical protein R5R73_04855 [Salinicola sp. LHM]|uniref:DUF7940 domain-containing protein n=1 Tax=Salinicola sp. LHM TaxID=3065298 RepID=UPI002ACDF306|nr:hypothetical protein [Salinicola sp. LHM]WQH34019.1 hypothetical protein R5R73_04855 [Salinicola sp. LHM]
MKLVPEARKAHKLWSVRLGIIAALIYALQPVLSHWQNLLPEWAFTVLATVVGLAGVVARLIPQKAIDDYIRSRLQ